jgi:hypothetical protein
MGKDLQLLNFMARFGYSEPLKSIQFFYKSMSGSNAT